MVEELEAELVRRSLYSDSNGVLGSDEDSYIKILVSSTRTIVEAFGGKYTAFQPAAKSNM